MQAPLQRPDTRFLFTAEWERYEVGEIGLDRTMPQSPQISLFSFSLVPRVPAIGNQRSEAQKPFRLFFKPIV